MYCHNQNSKTKKFKYTENERTKEKKNEKHSKDKSFFIKRTKEDKDMAVLAKPSTNLVIVDAKSSKDFIERFNKNTITPSIKDSCAKAARLFNNNGANKKS